MQIDNNSPIASSIATSTTSQLTKDTKTTSSQENSNSRVTLSEQSKEFQKMDQLSQQMDKIMEKNLSTEQKKNLEDIYTKLDKLYSHSQDNEQNRKKEDTLLEQAHTILESGYDKLSKQDKQKVDKLNQQLDDLTTKLEVKQGAEIATAGTQGKNAKSKASLTAAELNALPITELRKLPINLLKKLTPQNLNKLTTSQLNLLELPQLKQLNQANIAKLDPSQAKKLES